MAAIYHQHYVMDFQCHFYAIRKADSHDLDFGQRIMNQMYYNTKDKSQLTMFDEEHKPDFHKLILLGVQPRIIDTAVMMNYCSNGAAIFKPEDYNSTTKDVLYFGKSLDYWLNHYNGEKSLCENLWITLNPKDIIPPVVQLIEPPRHTTEATYLKLGLMSVGTEFDSSALQEEWYKHLDGTLMNKQTQKRIKEGEVIFRFLANQYMLGDVLPEIYGKNGEDDSNQVIDTPYEEIDIKTTAEQFPEAPEEITMTINQATILVMAKLEEEEGRANWDEHISASWKEAISTIANDKVISFAQEIIDSEGNANAMMFVNNNSYSDDGDKTEPTD
jgi:hypothetical protein